VLGSEVPVLPPERRLSSRAAFSEVVRRGRRAARPLLTVHLLPFATPAETGRQSTAGLVVSKAVGGSVTRHRTARRLRHLLPERLDALPVGSRLVVRAAPTAGRASSAALRTDLDAALAAVARPRPRAAR